MIRRAGIPDVPAISTIINDCAEYGLMLHRSLAFLYEHLRDFHVCVEGGRVVGVCGLNIVWANIAELYALAVDANFRGRGLGRQLVLSVLDEAEELGIRKVMTLTYEKDFFARFGFTVIDRQELPLKVWSECVRCAKNQACDEIAMIRVLTDVPEVPAPRAYVPPTSEYEVPVVLEMSAKPVETPGGRRPKMDGPQG